jgi:nitroimidazol reductase NimA-like FMN-containing flavoprotein (pyridoxamine 5'-phosphate oxidase superfamily)
VDLDQARRAFRDLPTVHVGSVLPDGRPHVVPLWFVWLEEAIYVTCREGSRVWRNLRRRPEVALQLDRGRVWTELSGILVHGTAELLPLDDPWARRALSEWFEKYRGELGGEGFAASGEQVSRPALFRVRPDRVATWGHRPLAS